jgi:hypothetical protein
MSEKKHTSTKAALEEFVQKSYWKEVAKEFHFDKPFHESAVEAISERLMKKFELVSIRDREFTAEWESMMQRIQAHMDEWDIGARQRAAQAIKHLSELIITC